MTAFPNVNKNTRSKRANNLSGSEWLKSSISIWKFNKSKQEKALKHPAVFPLSLVEQILDCFTSEERLTVLDPFMGTGTSLLAACQKGHYGIGFDIYDDFIEAANQKLIPFPEQYQIISDDAVYTDHYIPSESVDIVITSPPYWSILNRKRTADYKPVRTYGNHITDIGNIVEYETYLSRFTDIMASVATTMKPNAYAIVNVMDIRIKNRLYTLHSDAYQSLAQVGYKLDDIIIWDRRADYNNLRPLGYPYKFRLNRVHEYILILQKDG